MEVQLAHADGGRGRVAGGEKVLRAAKWCRTRLASGWLGTGQLPHAGQDKMGSSIRALEQGTGLMKGLCLCPHWTPTLDDSSEMQRKLGFFFFFFVLGKNTQKTHKTRPCQFGNILGRIIKMKLSSSLSRMELDSPCCTLCCYQLKRQKRNC